MGEGRPSEGRTERWSRDDDPIRGLDVVEIAITLPDGRTLERASERTALGSHASSDVVIDDPTVSRFHAEIAGDDQGVRVIDLGSSNGTWVDGVRVKEAFLRDGAHVQLGRVALVVRVGARRELDVPAVDRFGALVGRAPKMRALFSVLARCAASDATVLLEGETGTGKEAIATSLHDESARRDGPLVVVDCGSIPHELFESELFGHEKGAFTGAHAQRIGAFEEASGGTLFLDELGELPPDLQPKLLRALESRAIRRIGANRRIDVDVRVIAATHRRLQEEVNAGRFRADLYYRLAVVRVAIPPLRERLDDLPLLVDALLAGLGARDAERARLATPAFLDRLRAAPWPGNVRELRNALERFMVLGDPALLGDEPVVTAGSESIDPAVPYRDARDAALARFEREYVRKLLERHGGSVSAAARAAGIDRVYVHRLMRRHGVTSS